MAAFEELGVMNEISHSLDQMDWMLPTEIQAEAIPLILGGGDVLMASETGTGKTGAFCIPIVQVVYEQLLEFKNVKSSSQQKPSHQAKVQPWSLSVIDRAPDVVLSNDLATIQSKSGNWQGCRTNKGIRRVRGNQESNRRVYYEVHFADQGLARVGWSFSGASLDLGTDKFGFGYGGTAKKSNNRQFSDYGQPFGEKFDIIGCILNLQSGEMSFTKNGRLMGIAFRIPNQQMESREIYPTVCVKNAGCKVYFGSSQEINDYKPVDCIWVNEVHKSAVVERESTMQSAKIGEGPLSIIIEPSRELAKQTYDCINLFCKDLGIKSTLLVGGGIESKTSPMDAHIIVATPGQLSDTISKDRLPLGNVHFFVLDEADGLLQQGHGNLINRVHGQLPKMFNTGRRLQVICCSATLHNFDVKKLAQELMYFPTWIDLKGEDSIPDTVHHVVLRVDPKADSVFRDLQGLFQTDGVHSGDNVEQAMFRSTTNLNKPEEYSEAIKLMKFYYTIKAIENLQMDHGMIFCRTKLDCDNLHEFMEFMNKKTRSDKFSSVRFHSSLSQQDRYKNLERFKERKVKFLICTDVAARGIDIRGLPFVIQVTLPDDKANYIHRIGRVGRAERMGLAVCLVGTEQEKVWYHRCNKRECHNTRTVDRGGCCLWFDELAMLSDIEEHLRCTIQEIEKDFRIQVDEYDGKVVYGAKRLEQTPTYEGHVMQLKSLVNDLSDLETKSQMSFLKLYL